MSSFACVAALKIAYDWRAGGARSPCQQAGDPVISVDVLRLHT
jgi:hypothetical protein